LAVRADGLYSTFAVLGWLVAPGVIVKLRVLGAVAALGLLAGCVSNIEEVGKAKGTGSAFTQALTEEYKSFVAEEHDEYDWSAADYFARKGLTAAAGTAVPPEDPATYDLGDAAGEIAAARSVDPDLDNGGRDASLRWLPRPRSSSTAGSMSRTKAGRRTRSRLARTT
jgi:hypothetical protein